MGGGNLQIFHTQKSHDFFAKFYKFFSRNLSCGRHGDISRNFRTLATFFANSFVNFVEKFRKNFDNFEGFRQPRKIADFSFASTRENYSSLFAGLSVYLVNYGAKILCFSTFSFSVRLENLSILSYRFSGCRLRDKMAAAIDLLMLYYYSTSFYG